MKVICYSDEYKTALEKAIEINNRPFPPNYNPFAGFEGTEELDPEEEAVFDTLDKLEPQHWIRTQVHTFEGSKSEFYELYMPTIEETLKQIEKLPLMKITHVDTYSEYKKQFVSIRAGSSGAFTIETNIEISENAISEFAEIMNIPKNKIRINEQQKFLASHPELNF